MGFRLLIRGHARCSRPRRLRTVGGNRPFRVDRRQKDTSAGDDHPAQEAPNDELSEEAKEANRILQMVERTIAHIKTWRIFYTAYRHPLRVFEQTITAALSLYVFKITLE